MSADGESKVELRPEQQDAVTERTSSVALSSGAGCGKTTVLTARFLLELSGPEGRALGSLVALTFTDKAARELRQRVRALCRARLAAGDDPARWRMIQRALEAAPIGTFHEFCARLLRRHAVALGIDPEFAVLDETVAAACRDEAVRISLRRLLADRDADLIELASDYGLGQVRQALEQLARGGAALAPEETAEQVLERWREHWEEQGYRAVIRGILPLVRRCGAELESLDAGRPRLRERCAELRDRFARLEMRHVPESLFDEVLTLARISDLRGKDVWPSEAVKDQLRQSFERLRGEIRKLQAKIRWDDSASRAAAVTSLRLTRLADRVREDYSAVKRRRGGLDFDDLLIQTRDLLRDHPEVLAGEPGAADWPVIQFVLVDEFQDTDHVQSEILERLAGNEFQRGGLFVVGDVKQSIYRFRGAEPRIFADWRARFPESGRKTLSENFRSVPGVVHFVNALFAEHFAAEGAAGVDDPESVRLLPVRSDGDDASSPPVTFLWAVPPRGDDDHDGAGQSAPEPEPESEPDERSTAHQRREWEARALARWLRQRLESGWPVLDRGSGESRRAHPGDVALLFRAMTDLGPYERALADEGLDYHTLGGSAFFSQQEVHDVINLLSVIEDPFDEVALAGALRSPFFGISDNGLFWLARAVPGRLSEGLEHAAEIGRLAPSDAERAARASRLLERWRSIKDQVSIAQLLGLVLEESGIETVIVCEFLGARKLANTRKLLGMARQFDRQGGFLLSDFVARVRAYLDDPPREEEAATTEEESTSVRLMSIHRSKGLEFPIVVVPDLNRERDARLPWFGHSPALGIVTRPAVVVPSLAEPARDLDGEQSLGWLTHRALEEDEGRREAVRLFYVAATRARDHLVLSAGLTADTRPASPAMTLLWERFDPASGECRAPLPDHWPRPRVAVVTTPAPIPQPAPRPETEVQSRVSRPTLRQLQRAISDAPAGRASPRAPEVMARTIVSLDPQRYLSDRAARLYRLLRDVLADDGFLRGEPLPLACRRVGDRQIPACGEGLLAEAVRWLSSWTESPVYRDLQQCARKKDAVHRGLGWMVPWRRAAGAASPHVFHGVCDIAYRDRQGYWRLVILCSSPLSEPADRARLALSPQALEPRLGPLGPAWWVQREAGGELVAEVALGFDRAAVEDLLLRDSNPWLAGGRGDEP